jgi:trimeric autotransporter adhesin
VGSTPITATLNGQSGSLTVTVTAAILTSITIDPENPSIAVGTNVSLTAMCTFSDNSTQDCTNEVSWSSADEAVAGVSNFADTGEEMVAGGLVTGVAPGSSVITAELNRVQGHTTVTVTVATVSLVQITPNPISVPKGTNLQLTATCTYSDHTQHDCTNDVSWSVSPTTLGFISPTGLLYAVGGPGTGTVIAEFDENGTLIQGTAPLTITEAIVTGITVTPTNPMIPFNTGNEEQFTATATYSDGTTQNVTDAVDWTSSDPTIGTIFTNNEPTPGSFLDHAVGMTTITAMLDGMSGSTIATVVPVATSVTIQPVTRSLAVGSCIQFAAIAILSDGATVDFTSQVSWTVANPAIGSFSATGLTGGIFTAMAAGTTDITATASLNGQINATQTVTVTVTDATLNPGGLVLTPANPTVALNGTQQFTPTGTFSDGTTEDLTKCIGTGWMVTYPSGACVAGEPCSFIDNVGLFHALSSGAFGIGATILGQTATTTATVP